MDLADPAIRYRLAHGSFLSLRYRYLYFETPKVACTKTKSILWELEGIERREPWPATVHKRLQYDGRMSLLDCGPKALDHVLRDPGWFRFCFVRDPFARMVSGYRSKIVSGDPNFAKFRKRLAEEGRVRSNEPADIPFEAFVRCVCSQDDDERDAHWRTQSRLLLIDEVRYDFVGRLENYSADMAYVLGRLGAPAALTATLEDKINATRKTGPQHFFTEETTALVREAYRADFENFSYATGRPSGD